MDFFRAIFGIIAVIGIALLLGRVEHEKHPAAYCYCWLLSITVLLLLRFFL